MFRRSSKSLICMFLCLAIILFSFTACQDLGEDVKTEADYYALFPTVTMVGIDGIDIASMEDIYNKETSENLTSPFDTEKEYTFMIITINPPSATVLTCDSVAMFLLYSGDLDVTLEASCFLGDLTLFQKITVDGLFDEDSSILLGRTTVNLKARIDKPNAKQPQNSFVLNFARTDFNALGFLVVMFRRTSSAEVAFRPTNVMIHTNSLKVGE